MGNVRNSASNLAEQISPNDTLQMGDPPYPFTILQHLLITTGSLF
jgi:hypothetical protein